MIYCSGVNSIRQIQRSLKRCNKNQRYKRSSIEDVRIAINVSYLVCCTYSRFRLTHWQTELQGPGCLLGYRSMWARIKSKYNLVVSRLGSLFVYYQSLFYRDVIMMLLATMDEAGTAQRKSRRLTRRLYLNKGPNYLWYMDGYDKLKPYGIAIHGCVDGYLIFILKECCLQNFINYFA